MLDAAALKESWDRVAAHGDEVPRYFYAVLFTTSPDTRELFPVSMAAQRDRLVGALGRVVAGAGNVEVLLPYLRQLGRDHRRFAVTAAHYPAVGAALLATVAHFLGAQWTDHLVGQWTAAYRLIADVMIEAADSAASEPAWWNAEVIGHDQRTFDIAILTIRPEARYFYRAGQSISVETHHRPRVWRYYSPANAPRPDGTIDLHVRAVPGGEVSGALAQSARVGDVLRLGPPVGDDLTLERLGERDLLLLAGGTGLAPLKAVVEQVAVDGMRRRVSLFFGARTRRELYDLKDLSSLQTQGSRLTVVPVLSHDPFPTGEQGTVVDAALRFGQWPEHEIAVCGSDNMVRVTRQTLLAAGVNSERIHADQPTDELNPPPSTSWKERP